MVPCILEPEAVHHGEGEAQGRSTSKPREEQVPTAGPEEDPSIGEAVNSSRTWDYLLCILIWHLLSHLLAGQLQGSYQDDVSSEIDSQNSQINYLLCARFLTLAIESSMVY